MNTEEALIATSVPVVMGAGVNPSTKLETLRTSPPASSFSEKGDPSIGARDNLLLVDQLLSAVKAAEEWGTSRRSPSPSLGRGSQEKFIAPMASNTFTAHSDQNPEDFASLALLENGDDPSTEA